MKTTVYLNKDTEELLKRAKEYDPDYSVSNAVEDGLRYFVDKMNNQYTGMSEQIAIKGNECPEGFFGSKAKFVGKKLADVETGQVGQYEYERQALFLTKKGKYLIQKKIQTTGFHQIKYDYIVCNTIKDLQDEAEAVLLTAAGKTAGELLEDLDI